MKIGDHGRLLADSYYAYNWGDTTQPAAGYVSIYSY